MSLAWQADSLPLSHLRAETFQSSSHNASFNPYSNAMRYILFIVDRIMLSPKMFFFHSIIILYFFALTTEEGFLISPCYSSHSDGYIFPFLLCLSLLFFSQLICKASSDNHFAFFHFFSLGMVLITTSCTMSGTLVHSSSGTLSIRSNLLNLSITSTV